MPESISVNKEALAERMTELHFERHPEIIERYGAEGKEKCFEDAIYHLEYLQEAVKVESKTLFNNYLDWAKIMLKERDIPENDLVDNMVFLKQAVDEILAEDEAVLLHGYIDEGLVLLRNAAENHQTFLNDGDPLVEEARQYLDFLLAGNRKKAVELIDNLVADGITIKDIYEYIFQNSQYEVGYLWQTNQITVAHEHYCTAATQLIMSRLYPQIFSTEKSGHHLVSCSVADELHEIGIRMVTDFFEMDGWDTFYMGANMPVRQLIDAIKEYKSDLLALSVTMPLHLSKAERLIDAVRQDKEIQNIKILTGGYPFRIEPNLWQKIGADGSASTAKEAIQIANTLIQQ